MNQSDSQRLQSINTQLIKLYRQLEQAEDDVQSISKQIHQLESERERLPHSVVYSHKGEQYVTILRSAASSVQLQRHSLHQFSKRPLSKLSPDEIRQKNILLNKLQTSEKKIETYRKKLHDVGLLSFEVDDIVLEGYREQNQRLLQKLLQSLISVTENYLDDRYAQDSAIPVNFLELLASWENEFNREQLPDNVLKILQAKTECLQKGIPLSEIESALKSVTQWDDAKKQQQLALLKSKIQREVESFGAGEIISEKVSEWQYAYSENKRLSANQTSIVLLIKKLQMFDVSQQDIDVVLYGKSLRDESLLTSLKNRFRRKS